MFKLVKQIEGFETKLYALESPDSDKRAKSYTKTKIGSGIAIRKIADLIREKEKRRTPIFSPLFSFFRHGKRGATNLGRRDRRRRRRRLRRHTRIEAGLMGWGGSGRRYLKAAPGRCPARVRPEVGSFFLIIPLGRKKRNTKRTPKIPK